MTETRRTAAIIATHGGFFNQLVESAGFDVVGVAETAAFGKALIDLTGPTVVLVENELLGEQGLHALTDLRSSAPNAEFVLVGADEPVAISSGHPDAYAVLTRSRVGELPDLLATLAARLHEPREWSGDRVERRSGRDRRRHQDWSKVGWERRKAPRREEGGTDAADSAPKDPVTTTPG